MEHPYRFRKAEHLCLRRDVETLFAAGNEPLKAFPLRLVWSVGERRPGPPAKVLFSVSKRRIRHAVGRNRAKRQMREAYRLSRAGLLVPEGVTLHMAFVWLGTAPLPSRLVMRKMHELIDRMNQTLASLP